MRKGVGEGTYNDMFELLIIVDAELHLLIMYIHLVHDHREGVLVGKGETRKNYLRKGREGA